MVNMSVFTNYFRSSVQQNRKIWGVRHAIDVQFHFEKEMQEGKHFKKDVQHTRFVEAVEGLQDAVSCAQRNNRQEDPTKEFDGICAALQSFLPGLIVFNLNLWPKFPYMQVPSVDHKDKALWSKKGASFLICFMKCV